mmetsp:Transcript_18480/g.27462  ORF Transcript_18480/g.27462 Transcript_18480/m.27462 type:complete len:80 (-) Transcript_18480:1670-1909(-)|eukprot:CAMPEP_0194070004 /NCGR_PEP_ID=MMETSP0009_2-20130614/87944_1 /TAXON_ID=210454 /ORGANISM="Grammatophora oceanica, Strain CCMP 410" /LENGTH=79 /DNA_ID=CAMNT_0038723237 /DNA_START=312 /DNA_END=551 /DNA_ORIENTATION=-
MSRHEPPCRASVRGRANAAAFGYAYVLETFFFKQKLMMSASIVQYTCIGALGFSESVIFKKSTRGHKKSTHGNNRQLGA